MGINLGGGSIRVAKNLLHAPQVGPAVNGAVTHPGGAAETTTYADV